MNRLLLLIFLAAGCASPSEVACDAWARPLLWIKKDAGTPVGVYRTRGDTCYTGDTADYLARSAAEQQGLETHEAIHSKHQFAYPGGPDAFLARYASDGAFMAAEEGQAWEAEIVYDVQHGVTVDPVLVAKQMSTLYVAGPESTTPGLNVFGYQETLVWAQGLIAQASK
jgi:hypothetical protein